MNAIENQVRRARRRMVLARFVELASWTLLVAWSVAAIALVSRAVWVLPVDPSWWQTGWIIGSTIAALAIALVWALLTAPSLASVAGEIDARFGLSERLSSVVALGPQERQTTMGQALIGDAVRRAEPLDVRDRFLLSPRRTAWLPLLPALMLGLALLLPPATPPGADPAVSATLVAQTAQTKTAAESLKRKIQQQRSRAEATGLEDAADFFEQLELDLQKLTQRPSLDQKEAMIAMNDLKKQLDQRRDQLGTPDQMRQTLAKMEDMAQGPAASIVKAMEKGEFGEAKKQVAELADKLRNGELSEQEQQELAKQIETLRDQLSQAVEKHQQAKEQLQQQIEQARREGRGEDAAKMQQQLNQLQAQDQQMQQMQQMAEAMGQAAEAMGGGKLGEAAEGLQEMGEQLGQLQDELDQLQDLEETLESFSQSKDQMRCQACGGGGCQSCGGSQSSQQQGGDGQNGGAGQGPGIGRGRGQGTGPEEEIDTGTYKTQVRGEPKQGRGIIAGFADGPNRKGVSREEIKAAVIGAITDQSDPLENQNLPRLERDHAREYFDRLRRGSN